MKNSVAFLLTCAVATSISTHTTATPVEPSLENTAAKNTTARIGQPILDKQQQLDRWNWRDNHDDNWFKQNIPFWESPDEDIDRTYYYRWELVTKHMIYGSPNSGYTFSEFVDRPGWSGAYGAISCPLGLQMEEVRWLRDPTFAKDFARYWFNTPGAQPRSYSNWFGDAAWNTFLVNGDRDFILHLLPAMEKQYQGWIGERWDEEHQMFHWSSMHDGMEFTIASRQTQDEFAGADSYRPTLNSYVYGDLIALAKTAELAGNKVKARDYRTKSEALKNRVQDELWDDKREFFIGQFAHDEEKNGHKIKAKTLIYEDGQFQGDSHGRELSGFVPWQFNLPDKNRGYERAWKNVVDTKKFLASYGLYFTEKNDPLFLMTQRSCVWSGNNWPFANAQVLAAMANVLNNYSQKVINKNDYFKVLKAYTKGCVKEGKPYLAETSDPITGKWTEDTFNHSEHYFHSSYNDLIIRGLAGLRPRQDNIVEVNPLIPDSWNYFVLDEINYHGHRLSIVWDKEGTRYKRGRGLMIFADGKRIASASKIGKLQASLPDITPQTTETVRMVNFAVNNDSTYYPRVRASAYGERGVGDVNDGNFFYHADRPLNRWTTQGSTKSQEWLEVDFGTKRPLEMVKLYILDDGANQKVRAPQSFSVQYWDGDNWSLVPNTQRSPLKPRGHLPNIVQFPQVASSRLRITFTPQAGAAVGLSEIEVWGKSQLPLSAPNVRDNLARGAKASASFTSKFDTIGEVNDGQIVMSGGRNRWTAFESPNKSDWVQLDFDKSVTIARIELALWADGGGVRTPKSYSFQYWDGQNWQDVKETKRAPEKPTLRVPNEIQIEPVQTNKLRVNFEHSAPGFSGLSEWLVWGQ